MQLKEYDANAKATLLRKAMRSISHVLVKNGTPIPESEAYSHALEFFRTSDGIGNDAELYAMIECSLETGEDFIRKRKYLMAIISFTDAFAIEKDSDFKKEWLEKIIDAYSTAIKELTKEKEYYQAGQFIDRMHHFLKGLEKNDITSIASS
jgi:hypothetical protein